MVVEMVYTNLIRVLQLWLVWMDLEQFWKTPPRGSPCAHCSRLPAAATASPHLLPTSPILLAAARLYRLMPSMPTPSPRRCHDLVVVHITVLPCLFIGVTFLLPLPGRPLYYCSSTVYRSVMAISCSSSPPVTAYNAIASAPLAHSPYARTAAAALPPPAAYHLPPAIHRLLLPSVPFITSMPFYCHALLPTSPHLPTFHAYHLPIYLTCLPDLYRLRISPPTAVPSPVILPFPI